MTKQCCCGKCQLDDDETKVIINNIGHEPLGRDGAFCGPVLHQELRDVKQELHDVLMLLHTVKPHVEVLYTEYEDPEDDDGLIEEIDEVLRRNAPLIKARLEAIDHERE